jgi:putative redox protein
VCFKDESTNISATLLEIMSSTKKIVLDWERNFQLVAKNEKGLSVRFDASPEFGGEETALTPMENVLASLAACSSYDVLIILKKKRQIITEFSVEATAERREDPPPKIFTKIHLNYIIKGENVTEEAAKRAIELSMETYCSVGAMLKKVAPITYSFEVKRT